MINFDSTVSNFVNRETHDCLLKMINLLSKNLPNPISGKMLGINGITN